MAKKSKKFRNEEAWLVNPGQALPSRKTLFFRKTIERDPMTGRLIVWRENPPVPYEALSSNRLLEADDIMRHFRISRRTLERYIAQLGLRPYRRVGLQRFFRKGDVERWWQRINRTKKKWPLAVVKRLTT